MIVNDFEAIRERLRDLQGPDPVNFDHAPVNQATCPHQFEAKTERCVFCNLHRYHLQAFSTSSPKP